MERNMVAANNLFFDMFRRYNKILGKDYSENYKLILLHRKVFKYLILQNTCVHRISSYL